MVIIGSKLKTVNKEVTDLELTLNKKIANKVIHYEQHSVACMVIRAETTPRSTAIMQVYIPLHRVNRRK